MSRAAFFNHYEPHASGPHDRDRHGGLFWPGIVAVVFLALATASFALDQSVTLSSLPCAPAAETTAR